MAPASSSSPSWISRRGIWNIVRGRPPAIDTWSASTVLISMQAPSDTRHARGPRSARRFPLFPPPPLDGVGVGVGVGLWRRVRGEGWGGWRRRAAPSLGAVKRDAGAGGKPRKICLNKSATHDTDTLTPGDKHTTGSPFTVSFLLPLSWYYDNIPSLRWVLTGLPRCTKAGFYRNNI